jgi:hydroxyacyl-ACP dehydratase HTD2-like protein with hotdog domain
MAVWILDGVTNGADQHACLVDSVTETAFGTLFDSYDAADAFCEWCYDRNDDPREIWAAGETEWHEALRTFEQFERDNRQGDRDHDRRAEANL